MNTQHAKQREHIIRITEEIWENRNLDKVGTHYAEDVVIHTPLGQMRGSAGMTDSTAEMLHSFPDRRLLPQEIILSENKNKWHSSHRIISVMHARGASISEPATNTRVRVHTIADCALTEDNRIYEEWLVRDHLAIFRQLGRDVDEYVKSQLVTEKLDGGATCVRWGAGPVLMLKQAAAPKSGQPGTTNPETAVRFAATPKDEVFACPPIGKTAEKTRNAYADFFRSVFTEARFAEIPKMYHPACSLFLPGGVCDYGQDAADAFFMGYVGSLSAREFHIQHLSANEEAGLPLRVSMRWVLSGRHTGNGRFGPPSGAKVSVLGISHANFYDGQVIAEWNLVDEIAIPAQIEAFKMAKTAI